MSLQLRFPVMGDGGEDQGVNEPGSETFEGDYSHYVVRECVQNALDAAANPNSPRVRVEITQHWVEASRLPFLEQLRESVRSGREYWRDDQQAINFLAQAENAIRDDSIYLLKVSDSGTKGVAGGDEEKNTPWHGLIKSSGTSVQTDDGSAGAFGIGKFAPLAASAVRTTLYSTRTLDGDVAFQGISRLPTHELNGEKTLPKGYIGLPESAESWAPAVRDESMIPEFFRRQDPGLDIWIVGIRETGNSWQDDYICSALVNFWPAIHFKNLEMRIGKKELNKDTIGPLMRRFRASDKEVEKAEQFHRCVVTKDCEVYYGDSNSLPNAGDCELYVLQAPTQTTRRICMTRKTGMVIETYRPTVLNLPFAGLFMCKSARGNRLLKSIEPPRHDRWDPSRADPGTPGREIVREIRAWIREQLKELIPHSDADEINVENLPPILLEEDLPGTDGDNETESDLGGLDTTSGREPGTELPQIIPGVAAAGTGDGPGSEEGTGDGDESETEGGEEGDGVNTDGQLGQHGGGDQGGGGRKPKPRLAVRTLPDPENDRNYSLIIRAAKDYQGALVVEELTEDGRSSDLEIAEAHDASGSLLRTTRNRIEAVNISGGASGFTVQITSKNDINGAIRVRALRNEE